ncbi:MAG: hypothetical protein LH606_16315 [Cytophagaceae bacterium]|nr:hypothetical protein [Cytophagaceae bacterium]
MKTILLLFALTLGLIAPQKRPTSSPYAWQQLTPKAAFPGAYSFDLFATTTYAFHPEGIWRSADGRNWEKTPLPNVLGNLAFADYIQFNGNMYALGTATGNIETYHQTSRISKTSDFKTWTTLAEKSALPKLIFYKTAVFKNKIWLMGGFDGKHHTNEVWNSTNGVHWNQVTPHAAWSARNPGGLVVFQNRIYLLGGGEIDKSNFNDVWSSENGVDWQLETARMHPTSFWGYKPVVFDGQLWLLGCNRSGDFTSEVLRSADGKTWRAERAAWSPRGAVAASVFKNDLLLTGGKFSVNVGGELQFDSRNDVWQLSKN